MCDTVTSILSGLSNIINSLNNVGGPLTLAALLLVFSDTIVEDFDNDFQTIIASHAGKGLSGRIAKYYVNNIIELIPLYTIVILFSIMFILFYILFKVQFALFIGIFIQVIVCLMLLISMLLFAYYKKIEKKKVDNEKFKNISVDSCIAIEKYIDDDINE